MNNDNLTCISCGGEFSLTEFGKKLFEENNISDPKHCLQCSIIIARRKGEAPKNINELVKTNSTFWTKEKIDEYNSKIKEEDINLSSTTKARNIK